MSFFLCGDCQPARYLHSWREVEEHEATTGHELIDDSPDWTLS